MTPLSSEEYQAFVAWAQEATGWGSFGQQPTWPPNIGGIIQNDPLYLEWLDAGSPGFAQPEAPFPTGIPQAGGPGVEPEQPTDITLVAELVPQDWGDFGGVFQWSDGTYTNAFGSPLTEETALALVAFFNQGIAPEDVPEEPQLGNFEIVEMNGWDVMVTYDAEGNPINYQPVGRTEDRGLDDYERSLIEIQNRQMEFERFQFENLSAWQESQRELELGQQQLQLRNLGLQERIAQTEINKRPMDWLAAFMWSNPTWSGQPRGTPNPEAVPYHEIPEGGFAPPELPPSASRPPSGIQLTPQGGG